MSASRAAAFLMPSGTHFLCAGSSSSFPKRFHSPSSSKGVSTYWGGVTSAAFPSASSSVLSLSSFMIVSVISGSLSTPLDVPFPVWPLVSRSAWVSPEEKERTRWLQFMSVVTSNKKKKEGSDIFLCSSRLTYAKRVFLELGCEVRGVGHAVEVSLQDIPAHFIVERVAELCWHLEDKNRHRFANTLTFSTPSRLCLAKYFHETLKCIKPSSLHTKHWPFFLWTLLLFAPLQRVFDCGFNTHRAEQWQCPTNVLWSSTNKLALLPNLSKTFLHGHSKD